MTDVFIRTRLQPLYRQGMAGTTYERWRLDALARIHWLENVSIREGRMLAEESAESDPYIFTDDDVLIVGKDWVKRAVEALLGSPEYGAVSSLSLIETENLAVAPADTPKGSIYPMHAVGAPMVIRKGLMDGVGEMDLNSECGVIHAHLLSKGLKEGLVNGLRHNHMGHGFSSNPALFWGY